MTTISEFTADELKDATYVVVVMKLKAHGQNANDHKVTGLFLGMQPLVGTNTALVSKDEMFIWLQEGEEYVQMCHTKYYEVDYIHIGQKSSVWRFPGCLNDLDAEKSRLAKIHAAMKVNNRIGYNDLIDVSTYKDIPKDLKDDMGEEREKKDTKTTNSGSTTTHHNRSGGSGYQSGVCGYGPTGSNYSHVSTYKRKEVSTTVFKRTTRYPVKDAIEAMWAKIQEIRGGTYNPPRLKAFKEEKQEEEKKAIQNSTGTESVPSTDVDDDDYGMPYGGIPTM